MFKVLHIAPTLRTGAAIVQTGTSADLGRRRLASERPAAGVETWSEDGIRQDMLFSLERSFLAGRAGRCSDFWLRTYTSPSPNFRVVT